jgi:NitT/TauT family transport system substrate-binding protein
MDRATFTRAAGTALAAASVLRARAAGAKLEKTTLTIGTAVDSPTQLPLYLGTARTFKEQGLEVTSLGFRGDAEVAQALAGDSIDISLASLTGLLNLISSGQPARAFYAGFNQADFAWLAQSSVSGWRDLRGKTIGVSTFGSLTDTITRFALRKNGLEPERDVQVVQAGGSPSAFGALKSNRLAAAILGSPFKWQAQDAGFRLLGTQATDVSSNWPKHVYAAKQKLIEENPETIAAVLRGHVAALRLARANRALSVQVYIVKLKYEPGYASRAYDEEVPGFDERGRLPERSMPTFWKLSVANGDVKEPWPASRFLDSRWIDTFNRWSPRQEQKAETPRSR